MLLGSGEAQKENVCPDQDGKSPLFFGQPYQITLGNLAFAVIDTANADDKAVLHSREYDAQLASMVKNMDGGPPTIVLTHRPFWGVKKDPDEKPRSSMIRCKPRCRATPARHSRPTSL